MGATDRLLNGCFELLSRLSQVPQTARELEGSCSLGGMRASGQLQQGAGCARQCTRPPRRHLHTRTPDPHPCPLPLPPPPQVESSVRLLQLVSLVTEAVGAGIEHHLGTIAAALPQVCPPSPSLLPRPSLLLCLAPLPRRCHGCAPPLSSLARSYYRCATTSACAPLPPPPWPLIAAALHDRRAPFPPSELTVLQVWEAARQNGLSWGVRPAARPPLALPALCRCGRRRARRGWAGAPVTRLPGTMTAPWRACTARSWLW
jgi:hypothetical protein